jgi:lipid-A-disaccharide synthase
MSIKKKESYFISAGEASGDLLGADLALALKDLLPRMLPFGITGPKMVSASIEEIASIESFSVMGFVEVIHKVPELIMLEQRILREIEQRNPQFAILIDNAGFHLRLAQQLRMRGIRVIQYVAPKVWAWGENRVEQIKRDFELVLGILPFEEKFFLERGVPYQYVGSPLKDRTEKVMISRENLGFSKDKRIVACLPGSRYSEISRTLPIIKSIRDIIARQFDDVEFIAPIAPNLTIKDMVLGLGLDPDEFDLSGKSIPEFAFPTFKIQGITFVEGMNLELMAAADAAIITSGTATLECALVGTPMVVIYSMNDVTYQIAMKKMKVQWASLVNLIADTELVKEYIQDFSNETVANDIVSLLNDTERRETMKKSFEDLRDQLKGTAARTAAAEIHKVIKKNRSPSRGW